MYISPVFSCLVTYISYVYVGKDRENISHSSFTVNIIHSKIEKLYLLSQSEITF